MKLILSESQFNSLVGHKLQLFENTFNKLFQKKYDWFKKIEIESIGILHKGKVRIALNIFGKVYVDGYWGYKMFREYHWNTNFSDEIRFGDIIGGDIGSEFRDWFKQLYESIYNEEVLSVSLSNLSLELVDNEKNN